MIGLVIPEGYGVVQRDGQWFWHAPAHPEGEGTVALRAAFDEPSARRACWVHAEKEGKAKKPLHLCPKCGSARVDYEPGEHPGVLDCADCGSRCFDTDARKAAEG